MLRIRLLIGVVLAALLVCGIDAVCTSVRVRKSYDRLTLDEKRLYRRALQLAMDRGHYIKFVEMHTERMSEMEAHRVCMFTYWHRYFLLGFENMLRSLGPEFECITVPYWDELQHNARAMTGACTSMENCSPIVRDMGGSVTGIQRTVTINGAEVTGDICATGAPVSHFCEASSRTGAACAKCMPRGRLTAKSFPADSSFAAVYRQLFTPADFVSTGRSVENGMHNALHAEIGGAMATFQSPSDPLFWSHHAYVDLLLTIYLKCRVGLGVLSTTQKMNNPYAFVSCPHREDAGFFTTTSTVTMRQGENGVNPQQVNRPGQAVYEFFRNVPSRYWELSDVTQLGAFRYGYQMSGLVARLYTNCEAATANRRLEETVAYNTTEPPTRPACRTAPDQENTQAPAPAPMITTPPEHDDDPVTETVYQWVDEVKRELEKHRNDTMAPPEQHEASFELEKMVCMFYDQCRGGVRDYDEAFKKAFGVTEPPPCLQVIESIKAATPGCKDALKLANWKQLMEKYFPCQVGTGVADSGETLDEIDTVETNTTESASTNSTSTGFESTTTTNNSTSTTSPTANTTSTAAPTLEGTNAPSLNATAAPYEPQTAVPLPLDNVTATAPA